ncbi:MAG: ABC transporter ATP-binding protein [Treponema sp.]|jgi:peptide/nickel transport system ATP-binding protein/oligopeptide transport system ATP-binding protein|nr:ABC transporter ATP-binding protein [Treponema sp.]
MIGSDTIGTEKPILKVKELDVAIFTKTSRLPVVRDVSFTLAPGETLGLVGESGSGKSMTALAVMGLLTKPICRITGGQILFDQQDLAALTRREMQQVRGKSIAMVFQEPMTSLNPVLTIGYQIREAILCHEKISARDAKERSIELLKKVGIPLPEQRLHEYPHQLSGGMRQRVMISMALASHPRVLICDEPTTALDVTIQSQILDLISTLKTETKTGVLLITHDMGIIGEMANSVLVMYAGTIMEYARVEDLFQDPLHPYTIGLMTSIPRLTEERDTLVEIPGMVPSMDSLPAGCLFHDRCPFTRDICRMQMPHLNDWKGRKIRCWQYTPQWT